jgi:tRNA threonylcarbamoyladenosine biosynthesis protein TsaE
MSTGTDNTLVVHSNSEAETIALGAQIGTRLQPGDLVLLLAPFGAGKTHLTKGIAAGLGADPDEVNSPSFVIINQYSAGARYRRMPIFHADLYRIETAHDLGTVGLEECLVGDGVCIIEWAERAADWLPQERLAIEIAETGPNTRRLTLIAQGERYERLVRELAVAGGKMDAA